MSSNTSDTAITAQLADQLQFHWINQLRPRLAGLTDEEYFWAPVPNCWTLHPDGTIDFEYPAPEPAPFTTIAWRLAHRIQRPAGIASDGVPGGAAGAAAASAATPHPGAGDANGQGGGNS